MILAGVAAALHVGKLPTALPVLRESLGVTLLQAGFMLSLVQSGFLVLLVLMAGMLLGCWWVLLAKRWGGGAAWLQGS